MNSRNLEKILLLLVILSIVLRFVFALIPPYTWSDANYHLYYSEKWENTLKSGKIFNIFGDKDSWAEHFARPPLFHVFTAIVDILIGQINITAPLFASLSILASYYLVKKLYSKEIAFISVCMLAFMPLFIKYTVFAYSGSMITFFCVLSVFSLFKYQNSNKTKFLALTGILIGLAALTKFSGYFMLLGVIIYFLFLDISINKKIYVISITAFFSFMVGGFYYIGNWVYFQNPLNLYLNEVFNPQFIQKKIYPMPNPFIFYKTFWQIVLNIKAKYGSIPFQNILSIGYLIVTVFLSVIILIGFIITIKKRKESDKILLSWIAAFLLLEFIYYLDLPEWNLHARIFTPAIPAVCVLFAKGVEVISIKSPNPKVKEALLLLIILSGIMFMGAMSLQIMSIKKFVSDKEPGYLWIKNNTPSNSTIFGFSSQEIVYHTGRKGVGFISLNVSHPPDKKNIYLFIAKKEVIDSIKLSELVDKVEKTDGWKIVYEDESTIIYKYR